MRGLDPRIHPLRKMDCRVKPGNDEKRYFRSFANGWRAAGSKGK
jgi:hypothetical protein